MQNNYQNSIDMIYIDPPYNTGNDDFVYPDKFEYTDNKLQEMFGLNDEQLKRLKSIQGKSTHSAWLTFMYPRLYLAKKLLKPEGVIFISIDDNEQANLKLLMDELFGEINFISHQYWKSRTSQNYSDKLISNIGEYILVYAKNITITSEFGKDKSSPTDYKNPDNDVNGAWTSSGIIRDDGRKKYKVTSPTGKEHCEAWLYTEENFNQLNEDGKIYWGKNGDAKPRKKSYLKDWSGNPFISLINNSEITTEKGTNELKELMGERYFDYPKPLKLVLQFLIMNNNKNALVLDFFAGSSTTAHAVMQLNAEDGGNRKFIMVNLPEPTYKINNNGEKIPTKGGEKAFKKGCMDISEFSRKRIRCASQKIQKNNLLNYLGNFDGGFKHYRMVEPNEPAIEKIESFDDAQKKLFDDMISPFSSKSLGVDGNASGVDTILTTWLLADGYSLNSKIEKKEFNGYWANFVEDTRLYLIEGTNWSVEQTKDLLNQIGTNQLSVQTIVLYAYSFDLETVRELELGLKQLNNKVNLVKRF
ncbi:MAG: site-specific DNA-methyltransferase [Methanobrevibacter sp.]|jgi:adenine-specific DNA-methyltransferase|nr:site-specific DNA-methyltransferase [Candidatus Methanoflexus mossambicus]